MIFGHFGVAALIRATQRDARGPLAFVALCVASVTPDIVDLVYFLTGVCSPYGLYSHTIPAIAIEAAVVGGMALLVTGSRWLTLAFVVIVPLHLAADYLTMHKLVMPGGDIVGLNLFKVPLLDFLVEAPIIFGGWWLLRRSGRGPGWSVTWRALALVVSLQAGFDAYSAATRGVLKPNSCPVVNGARARGVT